MAASACIPLAQYLATSYRPDREYLDGAVVERPGGNWKHARTLSLLTGALWPFERGSLVLAALHCRVRVAPARIRVPDAFVVHEGQHGDVLEQAPLLVVEILSPDDTYADTQRQAADYLHMGVHTIWILDPETRSARQCVDDVWTGTTRLTVPGTEIAVDLNELFAKLDGAGR